MSEPQTSPTAVHPAPTDARPAGGAGSHGRGWVALVLLVCAGVFSRGLHGEFVYDDLLMVSRNTLIRGLENLPTIFSSGYWDFLGGGEDTVGYWRPLTAAVLTLVYAVGGESPFAFHVASLVVYLGCVLLVHRVATRFAGDARVGASAALLFGLHPLHVESVSWVTAINDPLFTFFGLLAIDRFQAWRARGSSGLPLASLACFGLSLLAKEMAVAVPLVLALVDWGANRRTGDRRPPCGARCALGFAAVIGLYYLVRVLVFGEASAGLSRLTTDFGVGAGRLWLLRVELLGGALRLTAWPDDPNLFRPFWPRLGVEGAPPLWVPVAWIAGFGALGAWLAVRRERTLLAALLVVPAAALPVLLSVESLGSFPLSDRFFFLAALGPALLLPLALFRLFDARFAAGTVALAAALCGWTSYERQAAWQDERALFTRSAEQSPDVALVHWGLGRVLLGEYRTERDLRLLAAAHEAYERARDLCEASLLGKPAPYTSKDDVLQSNLGFAYCLIFEAQVDAFRDFETPRQVFEEMTRRYPHSEEAFTGLGVAYAQLGDPERADAAFAQALERNPLYPEALFNRGLVALEQRDFARAIEHLEANLEVRAAHVEGLVMLARAREANGDIEGAEQAARRARDLDGDAPEPWVVLGILQAAQGEFSKARDLLARASKVDPRHGPAHLERGKVLMAMQEFKTAALALQRACELLPDSFEAHYNQGVLLTRLGQEDLALPFLLKAYELRPADATGEALRTFLLQRAEGRVDMLSRLAAIDRRRKQWESALDWAARALAVDGEAGPALLEQGRAQLALGRTDDALASLVRAAAAREDDFETQLEAGRALHEAGRGADARPYLERALALIPEGPAGDPEFKDAVKRSIERMLDGE